MWIDVPSTGAQTRIKHRLINCSLLNFLEKEEERWKERKEEKGTETCICIRSCGDACRFDKKYSIQFNSILYLTYTNIMYIKLDGFYNIIY